MHQITARTQIRVVASRWRAQYSKTPYNTPDKMAIAEKLDALDPETATAEQVAAIIGNDSWARDPKCHECQEIVPMVVQVGEPMDYESNTACLCGRCLKAAYNLAKKATP